MVFRWSVPRTAIVALTNATKSCALGLAHLGARAAAVDRVLG
jgi:hypothetical protein